MIWFTSDLHFGHANIIELCNRPFDSIQHMNDMLVENWNSTVSNDDTVYVVGDFAMGIIADNLPIAQRLNGDKRLILGNHDRPFPTGKNLDRWYKEYSQYFTDIRITETVIVENISFEINHFPFYGDSHEGDRFSDFIPIDNGQYLIHGHIHSTNKIVDNMIHVGTDAWDYKPASIDDILQLVKG
jgi:calcineurin-like phosphoesterase family protein